MASDTLYWPCFLIQFIFSIHFTNENFTYLLDTGNYSHFNGL